MPKPKQYKPKPNWNGWTKWFKLHNKEVISCCDCGLAHTFLFKSIAVGKKKIPTIHWRAKRNKEVTKKNRLKTQSIK